jgi:imidazolonepropionase-like amidohydrolase
MRPLPSLLPALIAILGLVGGGSPASAHDDDVRIHGVAVGSQKLQVLPRGVMEADYGFSERGRGDRIHARWSVDAQGLPVAYDAEGNDYWKVPLAEHFDVTAGKATWKNRIEAGSADWSAPGAFYLPANAPPEFMGVLARALLKAPGQRLRLLPAGEAWLERGTHVAVAGHVLALYRISGIEFTPVPVWLDEKGATAAVIDDWFEVLGDRLEPVLSRLQAAQDDADQAWSADVARRLTHVPAGALMIRHARLFDPRDLTVRDDMRVLVQGEHVVRVDPDDAAPAPADTEVIDAAGRFLMPGLWDVHEHFAGVDGTFDLIAGVTSGRDMANDNVPLLARVKRFDTGTELGPRVVLAGIVEGTGPLAGPTDVRVETRAQAQAAVDWYADHGYEQIKIYSSFPPALVGPIADMAHARGLRVSGHVPAFMVARQFVEAGADEIQHLNFIVLNFFPEVADTRTKDRYTVMADKLQGLRLDSPEFAAFVTLLRQHHTVLDPTVSVLQDLFSGAPGACSRSLCAMIDRFPPVTRRRLLSGAVAVPPGKEAAYAQALPSLLRLLKTLYDDGITLMPGTDGFAGYTLHNELELYVQAGIPAPEVLRMATLVPAQVLGVAGPSQRGFIAPGRQADMVLIDGDPSRNIGDIRHVWRTIKGGHVYDPAALEQAMGMSR